jgi:hypothetical protein
MLYTLESELHVGVLSKQSVKSASHDGLQRSGTVDGQSIGWDAYGDREMKMEELE